MTIKGRVGLVWSALSVVFQIHVSILKIFICLVFFPSGNKFHFMFLLVETIMK